MTNWRDIQDKAVAFVHEYGDAKDERKEAQAFWIRFFDIFGVRERTLGMFEERVKLLGSKYGFIDFFAPREFIVEHKSRGENLDSAFVQVSDYILGLHEDERPRYVITSDFARIRITDLEAPKESRTHEFALSDLPHEIQRFAFLTQEAVREYKPQPDITVRAVRAIGKLYEALRPSYRPEMISKLLTRLVFCFFADDTDIFNRDALKFYLEENTKSDGSDIGAHIGLVFQVLDTPDGSGGTKNERPAGMHPDLAALPYVNGGMFAGHLDAIFGDREIRDTLLEAMGFNWAVISPAIFGSMFQSVMNEKERHDLGAHYTSEQNILKVISGLFLEELKAELETARTNEQKLNALWEKIAAITLLDPACGCGNFLVIAYRELRRIETEIIRRLHARDDKRGALHADRHARLDLGGVNLETISKLSIERMHGIEIDTFPAEVAKLSLWLMDHMMNMELGALFGKPLRKLPLREQPHIVQGNALVIDWKSVVPKEKLTHILGNPPFLGSRVMGKEQKADMAHVFGKIKGVGELDYVTAWYMKAVDYIQGTNINVAFVSTNSITQGEQVGILWPILLKHGIDIRFAHRTFKWSNEASGKAAVYCVIIGFALSESGEHHLYEYSNISGESEEIVAKNINPYLVDAPNILLESRRRPICDVPAAAFGSMPNDGGAFLFDDEKDKDNFLNREPGAAKFIHPLVSAREFLQGGQRYCLWLKDAKPEEIKSLAQVLNRVEAVKQHRLVSSREATKRLAETPYLWGEDRQPATDYILIPRVSSENRHYVPLGLFGPDKIAGDTCITVSDASLYLFGVLQSEMHMTWMRAVCGRLESRYRYSNELVYNNFPWPGNPSDEKKREVEHGVQGVLAAREMCGGGAALSDLYNPNTMPINLLKAHHWYWSYAFSNEKCQHETGSFIGQAITQHEDFVSEVLLYVSLLHFDTDPLFGMSFGIWSTQIFIVSHQVFAKLFFGCESIFKLNLRDFLQESWAMYSGVATGSLPENFITVF
jgi:hypothetical protein